MKPCGLGHMVFTWVFCSQAKARSRKQMVAAESKKDSCQTGSPADECTSHFRNNIRNEIIEHPDWKQVAEARFKNSWTRSGQKQHLPALAEND